MPAPDAGGEEVDLVYRVEAEVRSMALDADVRAGGRLRMRRTDDGRGLVLSHPIEHPWKLYWVDPVGPMGEEVKVASVITLPEPSWEALERARGEAAAFGRARFLDWQRETGASRELDGVFAFVALGPPEGRFGMRLSPEATALEVDNDLTARWRSGELGPLLEEWRLAEEGTGERSLGYWFWNDGESEPFAWEPHTYHALAAALSLLALPMSSASGGLEPLRSTVAWPDLTARAVAVLETLTPKAEGRIPTPEGAVAVIERGPEGEVRARMEPSRMSGLEIRAERVRLNAPDGRAVSDRINVHLVGRRSRLAVEVAFGPADSVEPAPSSEE